MFNTLFETFEDDSGKLGQFACVIGLVDKLLDEVCVNYTKDGNARDAAIDSICDILQAHKSKPIKTV